MERLRLKLHRLLELGLLQLHWLLQHRLLHRLQQGLLEWLLHRLRKLLCHWLHRLHRLHPLHPCLHGHLLHLLHGRRLLRLKS